MYSYLIDFLDSLSKPPSDIGKLIKDEHYVMGRKGYGTPELEMKFLHKLFLYIQRSHPEFETFSWQQCNEYNDNYYHFGLTSFIVNKKLYVYSKIDFYFEYYKGDEITSDISFDAVDNPDPDEIEYAKENNIEMGKFGLDHAHLDAYWEYRKKKYKHLEIPCLKMLTILKLLEINFSMYYFLYTFGNGVNVEFNKEGVTVTQFDVNEIDGSPLGKGMDLDELDQITAS